MSKLLAITEIRKTDFATTLKEYGGEDKYKSFLKNLIQQRVEDFGEPKSLFEAIRKEPTMFVAAEFKRKSPSKGKIVTEGTTLDKQVRTYSLGGANMVSVLTEERHFDGTLQDMRNAREVIFSLGKDTLILRKDFIFSPMQLLEAKAFGADTALLIVAILSVEELKSLIEFARNIGIEPLVEVATEKEMGIAHDCGAQVIGINNRDLHTFQVNMNKTIRLIKSQQDTERVKYMSLSGIKSRKDIIPYIEFGRVDGVLIGESLMKAEDPSRIISSMKSGPEALIKPKCKFLLKICGVKKLVDVEKIIQDDADFIGIIFAKKSKRRISTEEAAEVIARVRQYRESHEPVFHTKNIPFSSSDVFNALERKKPLIVGVFQNSSADEIRSVVDSLDGGIDLIQLHDSEIDLGKEALLASVRPIIKVVHVSTTSQVSGSSFSVEALDLSHSSLILLDTKVNTAEGTVYGGSGVPFDWSLASQAVPIIIAGGINPENISDVHNFRGIGGVDVSSGVEIDGKPGEKDHVKIDGLKNGLLGSTL
eukprot:maker-scaffold_12-snap-gene-11.25-mRNA-1 protein AED:0.01 eAED:0.01 QI:47/1/1/1/0/0/2/454/534